MSKAQLALALAKVPQIQDDRILVGSNTADDAGVFRIAPDRALVHTVDLLAPVVNDPYTFGRIAAVNSLSDVYAMGGTPLSALNVLGFPARIDAEVVGEILRGGQDAVVEDGAVVLGGHTFQDAEIRYGLAVTGEISPTEIYTNSGCKPGDLLILTKPLGTGTVIQALMTRGVVPEELYRTVVASMTTSNRVASELMRKHRASACTDITGFGFLGHCWEMMDASGLDAEIWTKKLPTFLKVLDLIREGVVDAGVKMNRNSFEQNVIFTDDVGNHIQTLLFASETSGGLLISIAEVRAGELLDDLTRSGLKQSAVIGRVTNTDAGKVKVCK